MCKKVLCCKKVKRFGEVKGVRFIHLEASGRYNRGHSDVELQTKEEATISRNRRIGKSVIALTFALQG